MVLVQPGLRQSLAADLQEQPKVHDLGTGGGEVEVVGCSGLLSGRQMYSPAPVRIAKSSESWISGRQSIEAGLLVSEYQYIDVIGAIAN
jgi:hypothetical protein